MSRRIPGPARARVARSTALGVAMVGAGALSVLAPAEARATDGEVTGDAAAQFYDVRSPTGGTVLMRRRLTATVGVSGYDLLEAPPSDPRAPNITLRARLRYDADYGASPETSDPTSTNSFVPGFSPGLVDLMYAYVEGRRFFKGLLGFKLGRQYVTDVLGWWSFDGGEVSVATPYYLKAEVYGGLEQRGGMPLSTSRFGGGDGIWSGDRSGFGAQNGALYPSFQPVSAGPAFGAALETTGVTWIHGRLTYRRVYNTGSSNVTEFFNPALATPATFDGWRISSERVGYAVDGSWASVGGFKGGIVYDLYRAEVTQANASIDGYFGTKVTVGLDYDYYVPSFDGDSIWSFFAGEPKSDFGLRANVDVDRRLSIAANGHVRVFTVQTQPFDPFPAGPMQHYMSSTNVVQANNYFPTNGHPFDEGGNLSARWRTGETTLGLRGAGDFGDEGDRAGADITGEHVFETRYLVTGRAGVWQWKDKLRPDRDTTSANYVAGVGYRFAPQSQAMVDWEHDINGLVGQRFRLMLWLKLGVTK
jgi:hypothetical protein